MTSGAKKIVVAAVVALALFASGFLLGRKGHKKAPESTFTVRVDTCIVYDTIVRERPIIRFSEVIRIDTVYIETVKHDTVQVMLPIESKVYEEDKVYRAVVSGWQASLDSITVWPKTVYITSERTTASAKKSRWSLGASAGPAAVVTSGGRVYFGLGVSAGAAYSF